MAGGKKIAISHSTAGPMRALAFKVIHDPNRGVLVFVRVYSGVLSSNTNVFNTATGTQDRVSKLLQMQADTAQEVKTIEAGSIGVIAGSKNIRTGDTLVATTADKGVHLHPIDAPPPVFFASISPQSISDTRSMDEGLEKLLREDPSLHVSYDNETGQTLLSGMGELHLEIARDRLLKDLKAKVHVGSIMVSYKETICCQSRIYESSRSAADAHGTSQATVRVSVEPRNSFEDKDTTENYAAINPVDKLYLDLPSSLLSQHQLVPAEAIEDAAQVGAVPAFAVGGKILRLPLYSIVVRIHSLELSSDSTNASAVSTAVRNAVQDALAGVDKSHYALMEPIMDMRIVVNEEDIGTVVNDITGTRRGHVMSLGGGGTSDIGTTVDDHVFKDMAESMWVPRDTTMYMSKHDVRSTSAQSVIEAHVPLRCAIGYLSALRSMTQGRGTFLMHFNRYEHVPPDSIDSIVDTL
jgi:elongation factor G